MTLIAKTIVPTDEQNNVCAMSEIHNQMKISAFAGAAKSTTLCMVAEQNIVPSLMLTFNKSLAEEAKDKFPSWVTCKTTHSLAYASFGAQLRHKLSRPQGPYRNVAGTGTEISKYFKTGDFVYVIEGEARKMKAGGVGVAIKETVAKFEQSADCEIGYQHVSTSPCDQILLRDKKSLRAYKYLVLSCAQKLWDLRINLRSDVLATHDTYLKLYQLSKPDLSQYEVLYLDEVQDTSPVVLDIFLQQEGRCKLYAVGDAYQNIYCQPAGTKVLKVTSPEETSKLSYSAVDIENINVGDRVVSYSVEAGHLYKKGKRVSKFGKRQFKGNMLDVKVGGNITKYTADHHVLVRLGDENDDKYVTYLMRRGNQFRVGMAPWRYNGAGIFGAAQRASVEQADAMWVLGVHDTYKSAITSETFISYKYGVPQTVFNGRPANDRQLDAKEFWILFGDNTENGESVLRDYGLLFDEPLWGNVREGSMVKTKMRSSFVTSAANLVEGMLLCVMTEDETLNTSSHGRIGLEYWKPIENIDVNFVEDLSVYSMEVDDSHTYFADNVLTHNCWRGAVNGMFALDWPEANLSKSFRFGQEIGDLADVVLARDGVKITNVKGWEKLTTTVLPKFDLPLNVWEESYTMLFRTNGALIFSAVDLIDQGKRVNLEIDVSDFTKLLESAIQLKEGNMTKVKHESLVQFANWEECGIEAEAVQGELLRVFNMVQNGSVYKVLHVLGNHRNVTDPDVILTTAHKAKGREWPVVILADDFPSPFNSKGEWVGLLDMERNLLYVAITRAMKHLGYNDTVAAMINRCNMTTRYEHDLTSELDIDDMFEEVVRNEVRQMERDVCLQN